MKVNKAEYLNVLFAMLKGLPQEEREEILYDYEEHFRIGIQNGKSEEEIALSLGEPKSIARQYNAYNSIKEVSSNASSQNILKAIYAFSVLGFFNLIFVLGPFLIIAAVLLSFYVIGVATAISGIAATIIIVLNLYIGFIDISINPFSAICFSVFVVAFGILFFIFSCYINKLFFKLVVKYLNWNIRFLKK